MSSLTHLDALRRRLANERDRLANAKSVSEASIRKVWVAQIEKEIADEIAFLDRWKALDAELDAMSDDDLVAALMA